jgi:hypothetical protein
VGIKKGKMVMLVIGSSYDNGQCHHVSVDADTIDDPQKLHQLVCGMTDVVAFEWLACIEDEQVVAEYYIGVDYTDLVENADDENDDGEVNLGDEIGEYGEF